MTTFFAPKCKSKVRLDGKTAIITGCNTGIGKYTALDFCKRGCRVIMACRNQTKAEQAKYKILQEIQNGVLIIKALDLSSLKSIRACAQDILDEEPRIDLLINNAGVIVDEFELTEDGYEKTFATNHLGHFLFTLLLLPRILRSEPARIVNVSSILHNISGDNFEDVNYQRHPYNKLRAYGRSKLANILFFKELAKRLEGRKVNVYILHPGLVKTQLLDAGWLGPTKVAEYIKKKIVQWMFRTAEEGAQTTIYCAVDSKTANETGLYYQNCKISKPSKSARDSKLAKKLWDLSVDCAKIRDFDPFTDEENTTKSINL